jgi:D-alanine-D-alanine ligase
MKIVVLYGGESPEREVSLKSGRAVAEALKKREHRVYLLDPAKKNFFKSILKIKPDCAFIALHGGMGESGIIQGFLEVLNIPYTGSDVRSSSVCMNKILTKKILIYHKLPTPAFTEVRRGVKTSLSFSLPAVVKPANLGSTIGIKIVKNSRQLESAVEECFSIDDEVLVEEYIRGVEITAGILGDNINPELLPLIEIETKTGFYDYNAKYTSGGSKHIIPPRLNEKTIKKIKFVSAKAYKILGCSGLARMEMIVKRGIPYILDVNTIPGLTNLSLLPDAARAKGISFEDLCERILMFAEKNAKKKNERKNQGG